MKTGIILLFMFVLSACADPNTGADQCIRQEVFNQCIRSIPRGSTSAEDKTSWGDVVDECGDNADLISQRKYRLIPDACKAF